jgi:hypothetical protein
MSLPSHVSDGSAESYWQWCCVDVESCWRRCKRVMLVMVLPRQLGHDVTVDTES